jgi:hypothetical protein
VMSMQEACAGSTRDRLEPSLVLRRRWANESGARRRSRSGCRPWTSYAVRHIPSTRYRAWPITCSDTRTPVHQYEQKTRPCAADRIIVEGRRMAPPKLVAPTAVPRHESRVAA